MNQRLRENGLRNTAVNQWERKKRRKRKGGRMPTHYKGKKGAARAKALKEHKASVKKKKKK